ncbi:MAG: hypothetical protein ACM31E_04120 [Fibrobacterota bacterium]
MGTTQEPCGKCTGTAWEYQIHPVGSRQAPVLVGQMGAIAPIILIMSKTQNGCGGGICAIVSYVRIGIVYM